jgi:hypothetical protein
LAVAAWSGLGVNYGHQFPHNPYDQVQVVADLTFLRKVGISRLRLAYPLWNDAGGAIVSCQGLVQIALAMGFYVIWGVVSQSPTNASQWADFKAYVAGTLAPWAQSLQNPRFELSIGNEEEFHCDGITLTVPVVVADLASLATNVQGIYTHGPISYQASLAHIGYWTANGIGGLDRLGFNCYTRTAVGSAFQAAIVKDAFPTHGYIAEWGTANGYNDFDNERAWRDTTYGQRKALQASGLPDAYYFAYRDGSFGLPANEWALMQTDGNFRLAAPLFFGMRPWFAGNPNVPVVRLGPIPRQPTVGRPASAIRPTL